MFDESVLKGEKISRSCPSIYSQRWKSVKSEDANPNQNFHFLDSFPKRHLGSCTRCVVCPFLRRPCLDIECWRKVGREVIRETKASTSQDNNRSRHGRRRPSEMEAMMIMMNRKRIVLLNICWHYNDFFYRQHLGHLLVIWEEGKMHFQIGSRFKSRFKFWLFAKERKKRIDIGKYHWPHIRSKIQGMETKKNVFFQD